MAFDPNRPFNDPPNLPPASVIETNAILRGCIAARAASAEHRVSGRLTPNQAMPINSIPLLEAQATSEIKNIVTTADRLFRYANDAAGRADPATKEALRYRTALHRGFETRAFWTFPSSISAGKSSGTRSSITGIYSTSRSDRGGKHGYPSSWRLSERQWNGPRRRSARSGTF